MVNNFLAGNGKKSTAKRIRPASDPLFLASTKKGRVYNIPPLFTLLFAEKTATHAYRRNLAKQHAGGANPAALWEGSCNGRCNELIYSKIYS